MITVGFEETTVCPHNVAFDTKVDCTMRSTEAVAMIDSIHGVNCPFAIKSGQVVVENAGIQVSRVLYTKHSVEKRILIQVTGLIELGCLLSKSLDRIRSLVIFMGVGPCARRSWGVCCKNGVVPC
jgi:hypothetical protein